MATKKRKFILSGGGTGGHLYPALAIAEELKALQPESEFLFIGTKDKIEARVVPRAGYPFETIWISGFQRRRILSNVLVPLKIIVSLLQSFFLIRSFKPDVVIGTGGFVCGPVLYVASLMGIPTVLHESNSYPGVTTKFLAGRVTKLLTAFGSVSQWLRKSKNIEMVGTPTRKVLNSVSREEGIAFFGLDPAKKTVFLTGGSLGAVSINNALLDNIEKISASGIQMIWQTGRSDFERIRTSIGSLQFGWIGLFIERVECAYAAADVIVSRAGATTLAEIIAVGKPAILVPYPYAAEDHQTMNAITLQEAGAAILVSDSEVNNNLLSTLFSLMENESQRLEMTNAYLKLRRPDVGRTIALRILELVR